jgi:hypothetical protein
LMEREEGERAEGVPPDKSPRTKWLSLHYKSIENRFGRKRGSSASLLKNQGDRKRMGYRIACHVYSLLSGFRMVAKTNSPLPPLLPPPSIFREYEQLLVQVARASLTDSISQPYAKFSVSSNGPTFLIANHNT